MLVRAPATFVSYKRGNGKRKRTVESSSAFLRASGGKDGQTAVDIFCIAMILWSEVLNCSLITIL